MIKLSNEVFFSSKLKRLISLLRGIEISCIWLIFFLPLIRARLRKNHFQLSLKEMISISINRVTLFSSSKYFSIRCKNEWHEISDAPFDDDDDLSCFDLQV